MMLLQSMVLYEYILAKHNTGLKNWYKYLFQINSLVTILVSKRTLPSESPFSSWYKYEIQIIVIYKIAMTNSINKEQL